MVFETSFVGAMPCCAVWLDGAAGGGSSDPQGRHIGTAPTARAGLLLHHLSIGGVFLEDFSGQVGALEVFDVQVGQHFAGGVL